MDEHVATIRERSKLTQPTAAAKPEPGVSDSHPSERQRARERMRHVKPRTARKVVGHHRYWTTQFLGLYLTRCEELAFEVPGDAYLLAQQAPELARRIRVGPGPGEFETPADKLSGVVMALAFQMTCRCAAGELAEARLSFERAIRGLGRHSASNAAMAELHLRYAALELLSEESEAALAATDACLKLCVSHRMPEIEADAIGIRGFLSTEVEPRSTLYDLLETASVARADSPRGSRAANAALNHLIGLARERRVALKHQEGALRLVVLLKQQFVGLPTRSRKLKPYWLEGLMLANLGIDRQAERKVGKARKGLRTLGLSLEYATSSLDLAQCHLLLGDPPRARSVLVETFEALQSMEGGDDLATRLAPFTVVSPGESELRCAHAALPTMPTRPGIVPPPAQISSDVQGVADG